MTVDVETYEKQVNDVQRLVSAVSRKIAPVWPLQDYVAVNPFLGFADRTVLGTALELGAGGGIRLTMPREFYRRAIDSGVIQWADLVEAALPLRGEAHAPLDPAHLARAAEEALPTLGPRLPTVAVDVPGLPVDGEWVVDHITAWASAYFDRSLAKWPSPWAELAPWQAFQREAYFDSGPKVNGVTAYRDFVLALPSKSVEVIARGLSALGIPANGRERYLHRLALSIAGWCGFARQQDWGDEAATNQAPTFCDVLAIRLVWDWVLWNGADAKARETWTSLVRRFYDGLSPLALEEQHAITTDIALQSAYERGRQRQLVAMFERSKPASQSKEPRRVQAVFCIDVRSEVYRRVLEHVAPNVETLGFAGFFGFPISIANADGITAQCPVLVSPSIDVRQRSCESPSIVREAFRAARDGIDDMKGAAVGSFTFVETWATSYVPRLIGRLVRTSQPHRETRSPMRFDTLASARGLIEVDDDDIVTAAYNACRGMGLRDFAPLVVLVGHEAVCENNPHAAGLHCGACGGHSGAPNAHFAAHVLNDERVRARLTEKGCTIPVGTWFAAAVHKTTTDELVVLNAADVPNDLRSELETFILAAGKAADLARKERERVRSGVNTGQAWFSRSRDWSEPRPELGLAGCQAFVVAPRAMTRDLDFGGTAFLHSYDWHTDPEFQVLEAIMTAPMVVTNWINLQYFASTVDPAHFGCGNKVLHNIVGNFGVVEGRGGDLRVGLAHQSVYEGERMFHDPVKLNVFIAAPLDAINAVLSKHPNIRSLADNGWLQLWTLDDEGRVNARYEAALFWGPVPIPRPRRTAA